MNVPASSSVNSIPKFLKHIRDAGVPDRVTQDYLKTVGFRSSNDRALVTIFKFVGFVDSSGTPTQLWRDYRDNTKSKAALAKGIRQGYSSLFSIYEDAWRKDDEAIANWIRSATEAGGTTVERAVRTFKALTAEADFSGDDTTDPDSASAQAAPSAPAAQFSVPNPVGNGSAQVGNPGVPSININVELHLPATNDPEVYDNFFKSMKAHLFADGN